jgi:hypothetical protein
MKISKNLDPNIDINNESEAQMSKKRPTELIQVKEMKRNRYLNLPPIEVQVHSSA